MSVILLALALAASDAPVVVEPAPPHPPVVADPGRPLVYFSDYPPAALQERRGGIALVRLTINRDGEVEGCRVLRSSGHADLDLRSCQALSVRSIFLPARDSSGRRITASLTQEVRWDPEAVLRGG